MAKKNTKRKLIGLVSDLTGHRTYYTSKNTQNQTEKVSLRKYDPIARKHATYTETKKSLGRNEVKARKS
jgi:large subunit ribosomal protein L33